MARSKEDIAKYNREYGLGYRTKHWNHILENARKRYNRMSAQEREEYLCARRKIYKNRPSARKLAMGEAT